MRTRAVAREAWRNIRSGTTRTLTFTIASGAVVVSLLCADQLAIRQIVHDANEFRAAGASTLTLTADGGIDGARCEALNSLDGVTAAGAVRSREPWLRPAALPNSPVNLKEVTQGFPRLLTGESMQGAGIVLEAEAAETLRLKAGDTLETTSGATTVAGTFEYPDDGRRRGFGYTALIVTTDADPFDECWTDVWPAMPNLAAILLTTLRPGASEKETKPVLGQLNSSLGSTFDGQARLDARITRAAAPVSVVVGIVLGLLAVRLRRMELAAALHSGLARRSLATMVGLETASWAVPVLGLCTAVAALFAATGNREDVLSTFVSGLLIPFAALAGICLGTAAALALTREKNLFRYFKDR
ncbi:hypothetical protein [Diaminobutyricibacter sp. McL0608]|uniref:hypothetical protein n=1 Tax=Leifsonia sp. McL0608 TaxID=3143537 RepID=UPI0031F32DDA